jgi:hypothetical protein
VQCQTRHGTATRKGLETRPKSHTFPNHCSYPICMAMTRSSEKRSDTITTSHSTQNGISARQVAREGDEVAAGFVTRFTNHHRKCVSLGKKFTADDPELKDSAAISQLCRASQEMLEQAKEARALTEIYLALDEQHRDAVRPIIITRFKDIAKQAHGSWLRFCDSIEIARSAKPAISLAQREFEPHAEQFQQALQAFIAMSAKAH